MAENIITTLGDKIREVEMPKGTVIATTKKMIQILSIDAAGLIREWRFEMFDDGLTLYDAPTMKDDNRPAHLIEMNKQARDDLDRAFLGLGKEESDDD